MCDTAITPQVPGVDKLVPRAKVFIDGKNRPLFVTEDPAEVSRRKSNAKADRTDLMVMNINGEETHIGPERVVSVVAVTPRGSYVETNGAEFSGKRFTIRGLRDEDVRNLRGPLGIDPDRYETLDVAVQRPTLDGTPIGFYAIATGEDLGESEIAIVNMQTGGVAWSNPAEPERSLRRVVKATRLLAESLAITDAEAAAA